jgi:hypothetical protein
MRKSLAAFIVIGSAFGGLGVSMNPAAADTRVIKGEPADVVWSSNGKSSKDDGTPLIVGSLSIGDVIDVQVDQSGIGHGFVTIKLISLNPPDDNENRGLVLACGEDKATKPNAVLQEIECGAASKFGLAFSGSLKLQLLPTFTSDVNFWCTEHLNGMMGTLKLKP